MSLSGTAGEEEAEKVLGSEEMTAGTDSGFPVDPCFEQGLNRLLPNHPVEHQNVMPSLDAHHEVGRMGWVAWDF